MYKVTHFFGCRGANDDLFPYMLCELAENGIENVVLAHIWCQRYVGEPEYKNLVAKAIADAKLTVWGSHAPFGKIWDLDTPDPERRPQMIEEQARAMAFSAELGSKTITFHIGVNHEGYTFDQLRDFVRESLEKLLPYAEKYGIVMGIENGVRPLDQPDELLRYLDEFKSPWLGCTFDTGHANVVSNYDGKKDLSLFVEKIKAAWGGQPVFENHALEKLAPHIVITHVHDNHGYRDEHNLAGNGDGTIDWEKTIKMLKYNCPRLISFENETSCIPNRVPVARFAKVFPALVDKY